MENIVVQPYSAQWAKDFQKAKAFFSEELQGLKYQLEHVGSTSVEGLWAKPILDMDIIVQSPDEREAVINRLSALGYTHLGDLGIPDREAFSYERDNPRITWMAHHLYVCLEGSESLGNHLLLRDHLRKNPEARKAYAELKQSLAGQFSQDPLGYTQAKTAFITAILKEEGMENQDLDRIKRVNQP